MRHTTRALLWLCVIGFTVSASIAAPVGINYAQDITSTPLSCQQILTHALGFLKSNCKSVHRNSVCYGNPQVSAEFSGTVSPKFDNVGDMVAIADVQTLTTSPLQMDTGVWGLALLKLQANIPDSLPGQNVTFLVFGDTQLQNTSGDMQTFYFSTGLGNPTCSALPNDAILVTSPNHLRVSFTANDVHITMASTIILQARPGQAMTVQLVEGHAQVSTAQGSQTLRPGERTSITLGGTNGLAAQGAPSIPVAVRADRALTGLLNSANHLTNPPLPVSPARTPGAGSGHPGTPIPGLPTSLPSLPSVPSVVPPIIKTVIPPIPTIGHH